MHAAIIEEVEKTHKFPPNLPENRSVKYSVFNRATDTYPKPKNGTWDDFADSCRTPEIRSDKDGKAFCPATFRGHRSNGNAVACGFMAFDLDDLPEDVTAQDALSCVAGFLAFAYSSHSHLLPGKGARFRVVVAVESPIPSEKYHAVLKAFSARFPWGVDEKCFHPSRLFYFPSCAADRVDLFQFTQREGAFFDWQSLADTNTPLPLIKPLNGASNPFADMPSNLFSGGCEIAEGGRNDSLFKIGSAMRGEGKELDEISGELMQRNAELCKPPLDNSEVLTIANSVCKYEPGKGAVKPAPNNIEISIREASGVTELAMAKAIAKAYGGGFHSIAEAGNWRIAEPVTGLWIEDFSGQIDRWFYSLLEQGKEMAFTMIRERNDSGAKLLAAILKAERQNFIGGAKSLLRALDGVTVRQALFDSDPYLVGFRGGKCCNLKNGEIRGISPNDHLTKTLGAEYVPGAVCLLWEQKLFEWCCGDAELVRFLQVWVGYCLSGLTEFQGLLFLFGGGANGKSVFVNIVLQLLGNYAKTLPSESLMMKNNDSGATNDIARLAGARLVTSVELPEGRIFNENLIKSLTGGDVVSARFLYGEFFEFTPFLKLAISGNHKPIIRGNDLGIWRRINLVPFVAKVEKPDPDLTNKLKGELSGVLNWALTGWRIYQAEGLVIPDAVKRESLEYRQEMDIVGQWLDQCTTPAIGNKIKAADFYNSFKFWAEENGFFCPNSSAFGRKLAGRVDNARDGKGRYYVDVRLSAM